MSRIVVRTVAESRRSPAALLQIRCPNGGRGFITRVAALRCRCVAASVRPPAVVPLAPRSAVGRSACSATCRCPFRMLRIGLEGRSASEVSCRRSFRAVPASVPLPSRPAGGLSASGRRTVPHPGGPFRRPFPAPRARRNALRTTFSARRRTCDDFFYQKIFRFVYTNF